MVGAAGMAGAAAAEVDGAAEADGAAATGGAAEADGAAGEAAEPPGTVGTALSPGSPGPWDPDCGPAEPLLLSSFCGKIPLAALLWGVPQAVVAVSRRLNTDNENFGEKEASCMVMNLGKTAQPGRCALGAKGPASRVSAAPLNRCVVLLSL